MYVALVLRWSMTMRRSREISIPKIIAFWNAMVERVDVDLGGHAFRIVRALLVETQWLVPTFFTRSVSFTPCTRALFPVKMWSDRAVPVGRLRLLRVMGIVRR